MDYFTFYKRVISYMSSFSNINRNRLLCVSITILFTLIFCLMMNAQTLMRIYYKTGGQIDIPVVQIDSVKFVNVDDAQSDEMELTGSWMWGDADAGYYELLTFNDDKTYTGYDNYFTYGFDSMTYGWWGQIGATLNLQSNGFGYLRRYNWYVMALTSNALSVMTKMGNFIYYRVQPEVYLLKIGEESYVCNDGDYYVFTDGVMATEKNGKLKGIREGTTYVLKYNAESMLIMAYKVIVEQ